MAPRPLAPRAQPPADTWENLLTTDLEGRDKWTSCQPQDSGHKDWVGLVKRYVVRSDSEGLPVGLNGPSSSGLRHLLTGLSWLYLSSLIVANIDIHLEFVGGSQNLRFYWKEFVNEVDVLVFLVDSADRLRLPWARQELHKLLDKDPDLPVVVVANKQDLSEAMSMVELQQELGLQAVDSQREVFLLAASIAPAGPGFEDPGTVHIWRLLLELLS
ncbi:adp-ribosylation factor-like [Lynx pardinus]|uniref:Adp-ribosylation factor-like n=1 Tax=Lynx pardinus TaxID=191816 RepID=A0A485ND96_LYNPA|nr:adp-ribosylation factor-like [Lynx pardinus]